MSTWQEYRPTIGWEAFTESQTLTECLWGRLTAEDWHYLNFTSDSSCWESRHDGSIVQVYYSGSQVVELRAQIGTATDFVALHSSRFQLVLKATNA